VRHAVVGLGHIAQAAVLPAFANARSRAELVPLVSDDPEKLLELSRKYGVKQVFKPGAHPARAVADRAPARPATGARAKGRQPDLVNTSSPHPDE
jgi:predicted dehydrogenase